MELKEKLYIFKNKGYTYNSETGIIYKPTGQEVTSIYLNGYIHMVNSNNNKTINLYGHQFAWFMYHNELPKIIDHINKNKIDNRIINLRNGSSTENNWNRISKGYYYNKISKKYHSRIKFYKKIISLGYYMFLMKLMK